LLIALGFPPDLDANGFAFGFAPDLIVSTVVVVVVVVVVVRGRS